MLNPSDIERKQIQNVSGNRTESSMESKSNQLFAPVIDMFASSNKDLFENVKQVTPCAELLCNIYERKYGSSFGTDLVKEACRTMNSTESPKYKR